MKVTCVLLLLAFHATFIYAGVSRKTGGGSSSRGSSGSTGRTSWANKFGGGSSSTSHQVAKPSYNTNTYNQPKNSAPYPVAPQPAYNPAYKPGVAPVYPNQQRPPYGAVPNPQHHPPNFNAAPQYPQHQPAPYPQHQPAPSHFQQPGYGAAPHYPQQPQFGQPHGYPANHPVGHPVGHPAGHPPGPQVVNNYYGSAAGGGTGGAQVYQKPKSGPGIGTSLLAGAAAGVGGAALYNALTPSRHGSTTIIRESDRPIDRVIEVDRSSGTQSQPLPINNNNNNQQMGVPNQQPYGYVDPNQNGDINRKYDQMPPPVYCDELPAYQQGLPNMQPMPVAPTMQPETPMQPEPSNAMTGSTEPAVAISETTASSVVAPPPPPQPMPGYNPALGCIDRTPYGMAQPNYYGPQNGYWPQGQEGVHNTNQLNQAGYATDERTPYVDQNRQHQNSRVSSKANSMTVSVMDMALILMMTLGINFMR